MVVVGFRTIISERQKQISMMYERNNQLLEELKALQHKKEILEGILLKDKKRINGLEEEVERLRVIRARVTAYSPMDNVSGICADEDPSITATGTTPTIGVAAADPDKLEYGTKLYIPGYGNAVIEDTGAALRRGKDLRLDIVMNSHKEAVEWGVKELDVILQRRN